MNWFKGLSGSSKALVIGCACAVILVVGLVIAVLATGGFNGI